MNKQTLSLTLALALPASLTFAQGPGGPPPGGPGGPRPGFPPGPPPNQQPGSEGGNTTHPHGNRPPKREKEQPEKPPLAPLPLQHALDADHDGIIAAGEIEKAPDALKTLDKNKDGKLTPNEFLSPPPMGQPPGEKDGPRPRGRLDRKETERPFPGQKPPVDGDKKPEGERPKKPAPPLIAALDADHDGVISAEEIAGSAKALLTLDKNADGQLGPMEVMGRPPGERPEGDGPKPPRPPEEAPQ
ncbi:MAG: hypothetical protein K8R23_12605 [Chthoniobacter sp.]|nr:hypothetical protein [Chthoniobacter sp.]